MTGSVDLTEDELRDRATKIVSLLREAEELMATIARTPAPPGWREMLSHDVPYTVQGEFRAYAEIGLENIPELLRDWERLLTISDEDLEEVWVNFHQRVSS